MQNDRDVLKAQFKHSQLKEKLRGVNAAIILLSAACIEGFLVECLSSFTIGNRFSDKDTIEGRLDHDFLKRISTATFGDFRELFRLTLGKPISELISNANLIDGIKVLIDFRNGIAHGRSVVYQTYDEDLDDDNDYEIENQYKTIHDTLKKINTYIVKKRFFKIKLQTISQT